MKRLLALMSLAFICGCSANNPRPITYRDAGHLINVDPIPHGFFDTPTFKVVTDKGYVVVQTVVAVFSPGAPVRISSDGYVHIPSNQSLLLDGR